MSEVARTLIHQLGMYPPGGRVIDPPFVEQCRAFVGDDPVRFLRDLQDELVWHGGCADVIIMAISAALSTSDPESAQAAIERREVLAIKHLETAVKHMQTAEPKG